MDSDSASINIALLPDEKTIQESIKLSQELDQALTTNFILDGIDLIPHLTIYQAHYPVKNIPKIEKQVEDMLSGVKPFEFRLKGFSATPQGNIWWNSEELEPMASLQNEAIERCNPLREGLIIPSIKNLVDLGSEYENEINNYGSLWVENRYIPHISLTAVESENIEKVLEFLGEGKQGGFLAKNIFVGYLGKYGTVTKIIRKFELS